MNVGIAYDAFFGAFEYMYPDLKLITSLDDISKLDLIIFSGGEDINPKIYGQGNRYSNYNINRDATEIMILERCIKLKKNILGICRGHQLINAYLGGSLVQDLYLDRQEKHEYQHKLNFLGNYNSITSFLYSDKNVNSMHHQGVVVRGGNLNITSEYRGIIESCESEKIFTVQFHPEFMQDREFFNVVNDWVIDRSELVTKIKAFSKKIDSTKEVSEYAKQRFENVHTNTTITLNWADALRTAPEVQEIPEIIEDDLDDDDFDDEDN